MPRESRTPGMRRRPQCWRSQDSEASPGSGAQGLAELVTTSLGLHNCPRQIIQCLEAETMIPLILWPRRRVTARGHLAFLTA